MKLWLKGNVTIPPKPRTVGGLIGWARGVNRALAELRDRKIVGNVTTRAASGIKPPLWVTLITTPGDPPTYEVTVGWGYVCERIPGAGDAIAYHEAANMWDTEDPDQLAKFAITIGQAVYIRTEVDEDGKIGISEGDAVTIVVDADEESSTHYIPKVDDLNTAGAAGHYLYKLAVLAAPVSPSTTPTIEKWLTGSHIDHYQELPAMLSATAGGEDIGVIPKEWSDSEKAYKFRAIKGLCGIGVDQTSNEIEVKPKGDTFRVRLWQTNFFLDYLGATLEVDNGESPSQEFWVLKGIWYTYEPETWTDCGGGEDAPVFDVSYSIPTISYGS
jgi:hypothetical protein